ncbi:hypothetical protein BO70DRAFT_356701 [Aspergillus heteromorphus CBS 117.55]|uniref:Uncharacterized protein n=1 Tax=Aspergillus heteromorphus CBS 117.55 TaxID=1448321 RepID=A0A317UWI4_9EURO|nr:uncharacterized protein BO70DRAFT_356701 [Aspergillus heteromorphus CBS 117.55]PWY65741.1 hypothetical protein BO70DRAFT_356701 [Aspergillus heteromorphus CBS 117.55]
MGKTLDQSTLGLDQFTADEKFGYFHTYRTKREMRLVYFDGQSAAKLLRGTLDMQDIVLLNATWFDGSPAEGDNVRADGLCALARDRWDNRVDGFIRMVGGFEIILCSFADNLDVASILVDKVSPSFYAQFTIKQTHDAIFLRDFQQATPGWSSGMILA